MRRRRPALDSGTRRRVRCRLWISREEQASVVAELFLHLGHLRGHDVVLGAGVLEEGLELLDFELEFFGVLFFALPEGALGDAVLVAAFLGSC